MANNRYQLTKNVYMPLDGQWQIVLSGTVFDDTTATGYHPSTVTILSPGEPAGSLIAGKPTTVRNKRSAA